MIHASNAHLNTLLFINQPALMKTSTIFIYDKYPKLNPKSVMMLLLACGSIHKSIICF